MTPRTLIRGGEPIFQSHTQAPRSDLIGSRCFHRSHHERRTLAALAVPVRCSQDDSARAAPASCICLQSCESFAAKVAVPQADSFHQPPVLDKRAHAPPAIHAKRSFIARSE